MTLGYRGVGGNSAYRVNYRGYNFRCGLAQKDDVLQCIIVKFPWNVIMLFGGIYFRDEK